MEFCTLGIIERIFISATKYINTDSGRRVATDIPKDEVVYRVNQIIIKPTSVGRIKKSVFVLLPLHVLIIPVVALDKLFVFQQSTETCETCQQLFESNPVFDKACSIKPNFPPIIYIYICR